MDSDSIFYFLFIAGVVVFSVLNDFNKKKKKAEEEARRRAQQRQQQQQENGANEDYENWFNTNDAEEAPLPQNGNSQATDFFTELQKALTEAMAGKMAIPVPKPAAPPTPPPVPKPVQNSSIAIEAPELEGVHAVEIPKEEPLTRIDMPEQSDIIQVNDWRKAIIAQEILKTKF